MPVNYVFLRLHHLLQACNVPERCTRHSEALHIANGCNILTYPCLKGFCSGSCLPVLASLTAFTMLSHYYLKVTRRSNCLVQSRSNKSISHPHRLLQLNESTRHYEWGKTHKSLELVVVFFAMIPCNFPVTRYQRMITSRLRVMKKAKSSGCYSVFMTDMRKISRFEFEIRTADTPSGWETAAALREYLFPYIAYELEAISSTGAPSDGMCWKLWCPLYPLQLS